MLNYTRIYLSIGECTECSLLFLSPSFLVELLPRWYTCETIEEKVRDKQLEKKKLQAETYGQVEDLPEEHIEPPITQKQLEDVGFSSGQKLKPHQVYGVQWMCRQESCRNGGILADDMGVGKTIQTLSTIMLDADYADEVSA